MNRLKLLTCIIAAILAISCGKEKLHVNNSSKEAIVESELKRVENNLPKDGQGFQDFELELNILDGQIFGGIYTKEEFDVMIQDITDVIMSDVSINENNLTILTFSGRVKVEIIEENDVVKYTLRIINDVVDTDVDHILTAAYPSVTVECCSPECVKDTIEEIYTLDREVDVKYRKGLICREITYTYQDC